MAKASSSMRNAMAAIRSPSAVRTYERGPSVDELEPQQPLPSAAMPAVPTGGRDRHRVSRARSRQRFLGAPAPRNGGKFSQSNIAHFRTSQVQLRDFRTIAGWPAGCVSQLLERLAMAIVVRMRKPGRHRGTGGRGSRSFRRPETGEILVRQTADRRQFSWISTIASARISCRTSPAVLGVEGVGEIIGPRPGRDRISRSANGSPMRALRSAPMQTERLLASLEGGGPSVRNIGRNGGRPGMVRGLDCAYVADGGFFPVGAGTKVLVHAAAGGLGSLLRPNGAKPTAAPSCSARSDRAEKATVAHAGRRPTHVINRPRRRFRA